MTDVIKNSFLPVVVEERTLQNYVELKNCDFKNGTVRIIHAGYYKLTEDIIFDPIPGSIKKYPKTPHGPYSLGFFCCHYN